MKRRGVKLLWLFLSALICVAAMASSPRSVRTTRKGLKADKSEYRDRAVRVSTAVDTLTGVEAKGRISGYEKPLRSNYETALFTNRHERHVEQASLHLVYSDMKGRMLHSRKQRVNVYIKPGETGQIKWRSWDVQQAYYYHRSRRPRLSTATPYEVECRIDTLFVSR